MNRFALVAAALLLTVGEASSTEAAAEEDARVWLQFRSGQPSGDELEELKSANPSAYALVKALLVKQQLGLLDPRHPNKPLNVVAAPAVSDEDKASLAKMESEVKTRAAPEQAAPEADAVFPEAPAPPANHNWFAWKPTDSATSDDQMVSSVLGEVAALKGGAAPSLVTKHAEASSASVSAGEVSAASVSASASTENGASASVGNNVVASSSLVSSSILSSSAGSSALASAGAALGFDTGDAPPTAPAQQQPAAADGNGEAPKNKKNVFWGSLFDKVAAPVAAHVAPSAASQDIEPASPPPAQRAQPLLAVHPHAAPQNSYLSEYGLGATSPAAEPKAGADHPNPYLEMGGMSLSAPKGSLLSSRAKVESIPASSNPYLKGLDLFGF